MRFTSQHKAINQKEYGKAVSPLRYDSLALILSWSIFVVYGKQSEKNKYICSSKRHSALHTFWDTTLCFHIYDNLMDYTLCCCFHSSAYKTSISIDKAHNLVVVWAVLVTHATALYHL